jgi:hypothetical protein
MWSHLKSREPSFKRSEAAYRKGYQFQAQAQLDPLWLDYRYVSQFLQNISFVQIKLNI